MLDDTHEGARWVMAGGCLLVASFVGTDEESSGTPICFFRLGLPPDVSLQAFVVTDLHARSLLGAALNLFVPHSHPREFGASRCLRN